jgi:hypothetical protein
LGTGGEPNIILAKAPVATVPIGPTDTFVVAGTNVVRYIGIDVGANNWAGGGGNLGGFAHIQVTGTESPSPIVVTGEPNGLTVSAGSPAVFTVAASGYTSATWKKNGVVISDGPTGSGATISGATTNQLTITNVQVADEGNYGCELAASVYKATTTPVQLLTKRIISHWPLDSDANDIVGPWNGIAKNELYFTSGIVGTGALDYDSLVVIPGSDSYFNFYTRGFTCTFWFKHDSSMAYKTPVSKFDWSNSKGFHTFIDTNPSTFVTSVEGTGLTAEGGIVPGQWNFVATTYDLATTTLKLYVNGQFYARWHAFYPSQGASTANVSIGGVDPYGFPGQVDDVKVYSYAVDGQSIVQEYVNGTGNSKCFCSDWDILPVGSDCKVNFVDFARFAGDYWLDGSELNMRDLSDFTSQWLKNSITLIPQ